LTNAQRSCNITLGLSDSRTLNFWASCVHNLRKCIHFSAILLIALLTASLPIYSTSQTFVQIFDTALSTATSLLDSTASNVNSGPVTIASYRKQISDNVTETKASIVKARAELTPVISDHDFFANVLRSSATSAGQSAFASFITTRTPADPTLLALINQSSISSSTISALGTYKRMIIVGNYSPTGLDFDKLTNLETLQMFDGTITSTQKSSIQTLTTQKLKYLEVSNWGTSLADATFANQKPIKEIRLGGVITVAQSACFANSSIETVYLPQALTIGPWAFYGCSALKLLHCPNVTTIGDQAFEQSGLRSLYCPELVNLGSRFPSTIDLYAPKLAT
jgi:hypothetical protein